MKIALILQNTNPASDQLVVTGQLMINGPAELKVVGQPIHVFKTIELDEAEETVVRRLISSGDSTSRDTFNVLVSKIASAAFYKGDAVGHNEAVMER